MKRYWIGSDIIKKYKVYLSNLNGTKLNIFKDENKYNIRTDCMFMDAFKLKDIPKIQEEIYYYLVDKEYVEKYDDLQSKVDKIERILKADCIVEDVYYALCMLFEMEYYDDETMIDKELRDILKEEI